MALSGDNFTILATVEADTSKIEKKLKNQKFSIDAEVKGAKSVEDLALSVNAANEVMRTAIDVTSKFVEQVFELDGAITEFKKVSDLQGASLDKYVQQLGDLGDKVARTTSEMVEAATEFKKSGFSDTDAKNLALTATMYQNIADEQISAGEASNFIISQLKAFNMEASESAHVVDAVNEVANNFAISSGDLANNLGKASAALASGNTTFEQTLGLNKITNRPSKTGLIDGNILSLIH